MPKLIKTEDIASDFRFSLKRLYYKYDNGEELPYDLVDHPGAVMVIPQVSEDEFIMIHQFRQAIEEYIYEFPAGLIEKGEDLIQAAQRELQEEIGHKAGTLTSLGPIYPTPGFCNEIIHCFLAENLTHSSLPKDDCEVIEVKRLGKDEIRQKIKNSEIKDSKTIAAWGKLFC